MKVERYVSEGSLRVFDDCGWEVVSRLGREGETRISFPGLDFDYDNRGRMVFVAFRTIGFVDSLQREEWIGLSAEFLGLLDCLRAAGEEIVAKIDLVKETLLITCERRGGDSELAENYSSATIGEKIAVVVEEDGVEIGQVYFGVRIELAGDRLVIGVGDSDGAVGVGQPLKVNLELLEGDLYGQTGLAKINDFIRGEGF